MVAPGHSTAEQEPVSTPKNIPSAQEAGKLDSLAYLTCRLCGHSLLTRPDRSLGVCRDCYRQHNSPTCKGGFCSEGLRK